MLDFPVKHPCLLSRFNKKWRRKELILIDFERLFREWNVGAVGFSGLLAILQIGFILILADYSFFTAFAAHVIIR